MIEHVIELVLGWQGRVSSFAWTVAWQSTSWLLVGLLAARIGRRRAARAHLVLAMATFAAMASPLMTSAVRRMDWGLLPPGETSLASAGRSAMMPARSPL